MHETIRIGELVGRIVTRIDGQLSSIELRNQSFLRRSMHWICGGGRDNSSELLSSPVCCPLESRPTGSREMATSSLFCLRLDARPRRSRPYRIATILLSIAQTAFQVHTR